MSPHPRADSLRAGSRRTLHCSATYARRRACTGRWAGSCRRPFVTSMARGGSTFDRLPAAAHASMEAWRSTSISLGWKVRAGKAFAKCATCCPVPLPISQSQVVLGASIAPSAACRCVPSAAGLPAGACIRPGRQLCGNEVSEADVSSGSRLCENSARTTIAGKSARSRLQSFEDAQWSRWTAATLKFW